MTLEIGLEGKRAQTEITGFLPPDPQLVICLEQWRQQYRSLGMPYRIKPKEIIYEGGINLFAECYQAAAQLSERFNRWLLSSSFTTVDRRLREELNRAEAIRMLIRSEDRQVSRLPWSQWDFFERYPHAEIALAGLGGEQISALSASPHPVRILAILGSSEGIDVEADRQTLKSLPNAEVTFLVKPQRQQLNDQLWEQPWDLLFFAGHSQTTAGTGRIEINPHDSLTVEELRYALKRAIAQGLRLAIFNSCDGLGLAIALEQLHLAQIIVMREPVPDSVAQKFLQHFLASYSSGDSFYTATRQARERLQGWEHRFPCASWLPMIYQNSAAVPPSWQELQGTWEKQHKQPRWSWRGVKAVVLSGIVGISLVSGVRSAGMLQAWELQAYDQMVRLRPLEDPDERIVVVTVDEQDIQYQQELGMEMKNSTSLDDRALTQLLEKIQPHQPRVVSLDIVHDFPFAPGLADTLVQSDRFIAPCRIAATNHPGIAPPPVPESQTGFTNFALDPDEILRRQLVGMSPDDSCPTDQSLSLRTVLRYLNDPPVETTETSLKIGDTNFERLEANSGGYQLPAQEARGWQMMLNYRSAPFKTVPLREILNNSKNSSQLNRLFEDRIVLIGVAELKRDSHCTPYSRGRMSLKTSGVLIHAQMISQMISAIEDGRSLLWWWSQWEETLWIGGWSLVGGILVWLTKADRALMQSLLRQGGALLAAMITLTGCCWLLFLQGGWVPLIPAALASTTAGGLVFIYQIKTKSVAETNYENSLSFPLL
ncbi:MAG: CHASE2 domain-containing protein [Cyanophyceae cyanobacterium]